MKMRGTFCEKTLAPKSRFAKKSFRWKRPFAGGVWLLVACPKGAWKRGRCRRGMRAVKILKPTRGRCRVGKRIRKG